MTEFHLYLIGLALVLIGGFGLNHQHRNETRDIAACVFLGAGLLAILGALCWSLALAMGGV